jgi:hypothetical protein
MEELDAWKLRMLKSLDRVHPFVGINSFLSKNWMKPNFFANWKVMVAFDQVIYGAFETAFQVE